MAVTGTVPRAFAIGWSPARRSVASVGWIHHHQRRVLNTSTTHESSRGTRLLPVSRVWGVYLWVPLQAAAYHDLTRPDCL